MFNEEQSHAQWLDQILSGVGEALIVTDKLGTVTYFNPAAAKILHNSGAEVRGRHVDDLLHVIDEQTGDALQSLMKAALDTPSTGLAIERAVIVMPKGEKIRVVVRSAVTHDG